MKVPTFPPQIILHKGIREIYLAKKHGKYLLQYLSSFDSGGKVIIKTFDTRSALKNHLFANHFFDFTHFNAVEAEAFLNEMDARLERIIEKEE